MSRLDDTAVAEGLQHLPGWERRGNQIVIEIAIPATPSRTIRRTGPRCRAGLVPEGVLLTLGRELDAFREGNYVPIINEHC